MPHRQVLSRLNRNPSFWRLLVHLPKMIRLVVRLIRDRRVPLAGKVVFFLALAYVIWPIDFLPEIMVPVIGYVDDLAILLAGLRFLFLQTPPSILEEHLAQISSRSHRPSDTH